MTISSSLSKKILALSNFSDAVTAALNTIKCIEEVKKPECLKGAGVLIRTHINDSFCRNIADDSELGATLVKCVDEMLAGKPGSFLIDCKHLKNDISGNDHYAVTYTLSPPEVEAVTVRVPVLIGNGDTEAELSTYSPLSVNGEETSISENTLDVFISIASSFILESAWLPKFVDEDTLQKAHATLESAEPILSQIPLPA